MQSSHFLFRRCTRTGVGIEPSANGARQPVRKNGALGRQRKREDITSKCKGRCDVKNCHVVELGDRAVVRVHQNFARLHETFGSNED